jgi:hypothetical protein
MLPRLAVPVVAAVFVAGCQTATVTAKTDPEPAARMMPASTLGIPPGHLPKLGLCRIWIPGVPPGRQSEPSRSCNGIAQRAPAGSWVVYRPTSDKQHVHVRVVDHRRSGVVVTTRIYETGSGSFVREQRP